MKLWKLEQTAYGKKQVPSYEISDGCVVAADHPHQARQIAAEHAGDKGEGFWMTTILSSCKMISGVASTRIKAGLIVRSFRHG